VVKKSLKNETTPKRVFFSWLAQRNTEAGGQLGSLKVCFESLL
jgi:hypothetical protein